MDQEQRLKEVEAQITEWKSIGFIIALLYVVFSCAGCSAKAWGSLLSNTGNSMKQSTQNQFQQKQPYNCTTYDGGITYQCY